MEMFQCDKQKCINVISLPADVIRQFRHPLKKAVISDRAALSALEFMLFLMY